MSMCLICLRLHFEEDTTKRWVIELLDSDGDGARATFGLQGKGPWKQHLGGVEPPWIREEMKWEGSKLPGTQSFFVWCVNG